MKTIIAGSRSFPESDYQILVEVMDKIGWTPTSVLSGTASGADRLGERWAKEGGIPILRFPADWDKYGVQAGHIRNLEMAQEAEALVAFWDGTSRGTKNMIETANRMRLKVFLHMLGGE